MWIILVILHMNGDVLIGPLNQTIKYKSLDECMSYIHSEAGKYHPPPNSRAIFRCAIEEMGA